ncbi:unnamed protein product [Parajaminaea phylloscopi]
MLFSRRPSLPSVVPYGQSLAHNAAEPSPVFHEGVDNSDDSDDEPALDTPRHRLVSLDCLGLSLNDKPCLRAGSPAIDESHLVTLQRTPSSVASLDSLRPSPTTITEFGALAEKKLQRDSADPIVLVVGVGYVGEQLVSAFSSVYTTYALDVSAPRRELLRNQYEDNRNVTVIGDITEHPDAMNFDLALISVPTLLRPDCKGVDTSHIESAVSLVTRYAKPFSTVVVESSVTVGMTRSLLSPLRERQVFVGFSPERVDPGRKFPLFEDIPKVLSGIDDDSLDQVHQYYDRVFARTVPVKSLETAEFTKLFENCQRLMLISYVNEMADACSEHGVDIFDVCEAASSKPFGYSPFTPSLGAGGHCIPVNPWYLLSNCNLPLLQHAAESNRDRALNKAQEVANLAKKVSSLRASQCSAAAPSRAKAGRVLVYGVGFKKGSDCLSYSPSVILAKELSSLGVDVEYADPAVSSLSCPRFDTADFGKRVPRHGAEGDESILDASFDVIAVAHRPEASDKAVFDSLRHCQVVYFSR